MRIASGSEVLRRILPIPNISTGSFVLRFWTFPFGVLAAYDGWNAHDVLRFGVSEVEATQTCYLVCAVRAQCSHLALFSIAGCKKKVQFSRIFHNNKKMLMSRRGHIS